MFSHVSLFLSSLCSFSFFPCSLCPLGERNEGVFYYGIVIVMKLIYEQAFSLFTLFPSVLINQMSVKHLAPCHSCQRDTLGDEGKPKHPTNFPLSYWNILSSVHSPSAKVVTYSFFFCVCPPRLCIFNTENLLLFTTSIYHY